MTHIGHGVVRVVDVHVLRVGGEVVEAVDVVLLKGILLDESLFYSM